MTSSPPTPNKRGGASVWGLFALLFCLPLQVWGVTDTLRSDYGDRVILNYIITATEGRHTVKFDRNVKVLLGTTNSEEYKVADVKTMFFDRAGDYTGIEFAASSVATEPFLVNSDLIGYERSNDGYFIVEDAEQELRFSLRANRATLSIPVYLACYEKQRFKRHGRYKVFARCDNLIISLKKASSRPTRGGDVARDDELDEDIAIDEEVLPDGGLEDKVKIRLQRFGDLLMAGEMTEELKRAAVALEDLQYQVSDEQLKSQIASALHSYDEMARPVATDPWPAQKDSIKRRMAYIRDQLEKIEDLPESDRGDLKALSTQLLKSSYDIKARDSELAREMKQTAEDCDKAFKKMEDSAKRRNMWLIIGGVLLAVLMFVGGQVAQHLRNKKNMASFQNTQAEITKRAENEAKRRAQGAVRSKISRMESEVRNKSRDAVRNGINGVIKGKNITNV